MIDTLLRLLPRATHRRLNFMWRYLRGETPWDTNETPPEVKAFVREATPGRALDLGCGTGTNVLFLAEHGWQATGVDFVAQAIKAARDKAAAQGAQAAFFQGDVTHLEALPLDGPFDLLLDIGCMHSLTEAGQARYAAQLARLAAPNACYMLYAGLPREHPTGQIGIAPERVATLFAPHFAIERQEIGEDTGGGWARGWYWLRRVQSGS